MKRLPFAASAAVLFGSLFLLVPASRSAPPPKCDGRAATIVGTAGDDVITGTKHRDVIAALGGDDVIDGGGGADTICGGDGTDTVAYASATGGVVADLGAGSATTGGVTDRLLAIENLVGTSSADSLVGDANANVLTGGAGDDDLVGGGGLDTADFSGAPGGLTVDLAVGTAVGDGSDTLAGIESVVGTPFDDDVFGDANANTLTGGPGADLLQSFGGDDTLGGGTGDDILRAGDGTDAADGGDGTDACVDAESISSCERGGGTFTAVMPFGIGSTDPALDYVSTGWQIEYATCLKLLNFADDASPFPVPQPEAATGMPLVSADGRTYTFTIRSGLRFAPPSGEPVTAETYKHSIERLFSPAIQSPALPFAADIQSVTAVGQALTIQLAKPAADFLARLTMPFFCAVPSSTPMTVMEAPVGAGPYSMTEYVRDARIVLTRNPNYRGRRPSNFDRIVFDIGASFDANQAAVDAGTADYAAAGIPPANYAAAAPLLGTRFFVSPQPGFAYVALNTSRPVFANPTLRAAVATALNRQPLVDAAGAFAGSPTDQYLSPGTPGFVDADIYPLGGDLVAAAALAASQGVTPATPVNVVLYSSFLGAPFQRATIIQATLAQIGFNVTIQTFSRAEQIQRVGTRGEPFDMTLEGWILDYNDPFDVLGVLLDGRTIRATNNNDVSYYDDPVFEARLDAANALSGQARYDAYTALEHDVVRASPLVAFMNFNQRDYFSARIGCQHFGSFGMSLAALCLR